jgi:phosphate transport system protein
MKGKQCKICHNYRPGGHEMPQVFQAELTEVQTRLVEMSESVANIMQKATTAFLDSDIAKADEAIALAETNKSKASALDRLAIRIISRQSPVARDLRILVAALRISASLERMGALAGHIATIAKYRYPDSAIPKILRPTFKELSRLDIELASRVSKLLKNTDVDLARLIQGEDARVDELHQNVFDIVLSKKWKENAVYTVDVTLASRYFERFADHVVDISTKVSYLSTGAWHDIDEVEEFHYFLP